MEEDKRKEGYKPTVPIIRSAPKSPPVPKDFGEYRVIDEVGCGGMGWILKAVHKKLDVVHALKILHPALSQHEEFITNFKREAQLSAKLQHPNIVTIHNTGEFAGYHYIAMEFIEGADLAKKLPEKGMDPLVVLAIAVKILDALDHAHNYEFSYQGQTYYGLIHRDIKPENIIVDKTGEVKITDFGIARGIHLYGDVTTEGTIVGTPSYMSPEQIDGAQKISHTTDIYSLGVVMYELLSGEKAFSGTTTQIIRKISNHEYESLGRINRRIPAEITKIVDKAMSFNPEERFQSAYEMRVAINRYLSQYQYDDPTTIIKKYFVERITPPPTRREKREKRKKPRKILAKTAKVLGVIALICIILFGFLYLREWWRKHSAESALVDLVERSERAKANIASISTMDFGTVENLLDSANVLSYSVDNLLDSANVLFDSKAYSDTKTLCGSAEGVLDSLIILINQAIRVKYEHISDKAKKAEELKSTVDFKGDYFVLVDSLIKTQEFDGADSVLNEALDKANREIWRLTVKPEEKDELAELAQRKLKEVKERLAEAKRDFPDTNFSDVEGLIAEAEKFCGRRQWMECSNKSSEAETLIRRKTRPPPCPVVEKARGHYDSLTAEQKKRLEHERQRMNELAGLGRCEAAEAFAAIILKEKIPGEPKKEERSEPVVPEPEEELTDSAHFVMGTNLEANGDLESAVKHYQEVKPANTKAESWKFYLPARFRMGIISQNQKQYKKAISAYKEVLSLNNTNYYPSCFLNIGVCFFEISLYDSAITYLEEVERYKILIPVDPAKGEDKYYHTDLWHDAMYYWALALTKSYDKETDPEKKEQLKKDAIGKWENDYLGDFGKDTEHPRRGKYVKNAQVYLKNLKLDG